MPRSIREIAIVIILVGLALLLIFSSSLNSGYSVAGRLVYSALRPFQQVFFGLRETITNYWSGYTELVAVRSENQELRQQVQRLRQDISGLSNLQSENRRLLKLLNLKSAFEFPSTVAQVIGEDATGWYRTLFVNRGQEDGVFTGMPVVAGQGLVGKIGRTSGNSSQVILISDPHSSLDCRVERTRDRGVVSGSLEKGCLMRYINEYSSVRQGDQVLTSGLDGIFPKGLPVGSVQSVRKSDQGLFLEARVVPFVNLSDLEEVLIILGKQGGFDIQSPIEELR
jgi:rod shape-determining protein MreC